MMKIVMELDTSLKKREDWEKKGFNLMYDILEDNDIKCNLYNDGGGDTSNF